MIIHVFKNKYALSAHVVLLICFLFPLSTTAQTVSTDLANLRASSPATTEAYERIDIFNAWHAITGSNVPLFPVTIGIVDTGIDARHQEFQATASVGTSGAVVNLGITPPDAKTDTLGHGTAVAGIIGANNLLGAGFSIPASSPQMNGILSGPAHLPYTLEVRKSGSGGKLNSFSVTKAFVTLNAPIINLSSGNPRPSDSGGNLKWLIWDNALRLVMETHSSKLFVLAAGNGGIDASNFSPARNGDLANVITVGATKNDSDTRATFPPPDVASNYGSVVSLSAPGTNVYAPKPNNQYNPHFSGTSASAPLVTGVAGLLKAVKPELTPAEIKHILISDSSTDPISIEAGKPIGRRLNALKAVRQVLPPERPAFFEGWDSLPIGHPLCEIPFESSFINCAFTADSGQWLVTEWRNVNTPLGSPIPSVEVLPGKILKIIPAQVGVFPIKIGSATARAATVGFPFIPLSPTTVFSFTDHVTIIAPGTHARVEVVVALAAPGGSAPCPNGSTFSDTTIIYVLESTSQNTPVAAPCTARITVGSGTSFSRNLHDDFARFLPFAPEGWSIFQISMRVVPDTLSDTDISTTWDNVMITR